jgi:hypothetical protein
MEQNRILKQSVCSILKDRGEPISFDTIWDSIEKDGHLKSSTLGSLLSGDDAFVRWGQDLWGLKSWLVNDVRFRVHLNEKELAGGCFTVNHELVLFFPRQATWDVPLEFYYTDDKKVDVVFSPALRRVTGLSPVYESFGACVGDDLIIDVVDVDSHLYRIIVEPAKDKDMETVGRLNKRIVDIAYEVFPDDGYAMLSNVLVSILLKINLKGEYPPDRLPRILKQDLRFCQDPDYGLFQLSGARSMLLDALSNSNRVRSIIEKHLDPARALKEILGSNLDLADREEADKLLEQFLALWNMIKVSSGNFR